MEKLQRNIATNFDLKNELGIEVLVGPKIIVFLVFNALKSIENNNYKLGKGQD